MHQVQRLRLLTSFLLFAAIAPGQASITGAVIDGDGKAIAGARISMYPPETLDARRLRLQSKTIERVPLTSTQSDSKGNFTLESPKEPVVDVRIEAAGFAPDAVRSLADDDLGAVSLFRASMVKGTITSGGKPVAGASVAWSGAAEVVSLTDAQGGYSVPDPAKWASRLTVVHPDFAILDENVGPNMPKKGADRTLNGGVAISGRVLAEDGQTAVAGAVVIVDNWKLATTADDGSFTVAHAMKDWAQVEAQAGEKAGVRAHSGNGAVAIRLAKAAAVTGSVVDLKTQLPVAGAEVRLNPNGPGLGAMAISSRMAFTDAKGRFTLKPVVPGIYQLAGSRPSGIVTGSSISVNAGQNVSKPLYLTARGRISGSVIDEDKHPIAGARVNFRNATGDPLGFPIMGPRQNGPAAGFSAPDGHFVLRSVPTDADLRIDAVRKGFPPGQSASIRVAPGERKSGVLIFIPHGISLVGKVMDQDGKPLSGVAVNAAESSSDGLGGMRRMMIFRGQGRAEESIRTASDGTFVTRVKEGTYDVVFEREGFALKTARGIAVSPSSKPLEITLDPGVELSGRVTRGGAGVEGVNVGLGGSGGFTTTVTQSDGSFRLADLSPGQAMLSVSKPDAFVQQMRPVTIPARDLTIELPQGGRISGRVVDKSSKHPVTTFQAGVTTSRSGGGMVFMSPPMLKAFTTDDGTFVLENVPPGSTELVVNAPGYTTGRVPGLNVEDGKTLTDVEVAVETGVTLTGRVTGPDGSALSGVDVRPDQAPGAGRVMRFDGRNSGTVTDPSGEYVLEALEPGEKTIAFSRQGLVTQQKAVQLSGDKVTLNVQLSAGTRVAGVVVNEGGSGVADAMVEASSATDDSFGQQVRTDSSGNFQLEGLVGGHYTLSASKKGYAIAIQRDVDLTAGRPIRLVLTAGGVLSGHVTGLSDKELQQTTVSAQSPTGNASAPVDASGSFRIEGAPIGTVRVSARVGEGMSGFKISSPKTVQVEAGAPAQVDLEFKSATVIRGRVTRNGQAVSNAMVMFMPKAGRTSGLANGTTDGSGLYEVSGLDDASYSVRVNDMLRLAPFTTSYEVHGSGSFDIDIKSSAVRGRVLDASTGAAIADAHIEIRTAGGDGMLSARGAQTDSGGSFLIDDVARGSYEAVATKEGYGHQSLTLTVADSAEPLDFKLSPGSGIMLRVVDLRDQRPIGATARVTDAQGREVPVGDMFRFAGGTEPLKLTLAPGSYRVTVSAPGYASRTITMNAPSDQTVGLSPGGSLVLQARGSAPIRARLIDSNGSPYMPGNRGPFGSPIFTIEPKPASTTLQNVAPGRYRLEILDAADQPTRSIDIVVSDGQPSAYEV